MKCNMVERHKYFKELFCFMCKIESNTQTEDTSETAVPFCHNVWLNAHEYRNPAAKLKFQEA